MKPITIAISNNKGGSGKTTTAYHLAIALSDLGIPTLAVDYDAQANLTTAFGCADPATYTGLTIGDFVRDHCRFEEILVPTAEAQRSPFLAPANNNLDQVATEMVTRPFQLLRLGRALADLDPQIARVVLIDCPPDLGSLTLSALAASNYAIAPAMPEPDNLTGIARLQREIAQVKVDIGTCPKFLGTIAVAVENTSQHADGIAAMRTDFALLGTVPKRSGRDMLAARQGHYDRIAKRLVACIGLVEEIKAEVVNA